MKIFGWAADNAGCAWYRLALPLGALRHDGVDAKWGSRLLEQDWDADVLIAQRTCLPGPTRILQRLKKAPNRPMLVMELDDDLLHVDRTNKIAEGFFANVDIRANLMANMKAVDLVTVSTEPLAEQVAKYNPNVTVLPNCIPAGMLTWQPGFYSDRFTLGWQGSATHEGDWRAAAEPIRRWFDRAKRNGLNVEMHTGGDVPKTFPAVYPHRIDGWEPNIDRYYRSMDWHVALAPLAPTVFNTSKSDLRVLEAGMLGFPVVASDVAAYRGSVKHGETGFLVKSPLDWAKALQQLAADPQMRQEMAQNGRRFAAGRTVEENADRWLEAYKKCL